MIYEVFTADMAGMHAGHDAGCQETPLQKRPRSCMRTRASAACCPTMPHTAPWQPSKYGMSSWERCEGAAGMQLQLALSATVLEPARHCSASIGALGK